MSAMTQAKKDPRRQLQGAVAKAHGRRFEERLDASFAYYADRGVALIEKTPEPDETNQELRQR